MATATANVLSFPVSRNERGSWVPPWYWINNMRQVYYQISCAIPDPINVSNPSFFFSVFLFSDDTVSKDKLFPFHRFWGQDILCPWCACGELCHILSRLRYLSHPQKTYFISHLLSFHTLFYRIESTIWLLAWRISDFGTDIIIWYTSLTPNANSERFGGH